MWLVRYFANLPGSRLILWSYVIWWLVIGAYYFTPDPHIWVTSLGIGLIVGFALMLCTGPITLDRFRTRFWESLRLFICPFMLSNSGVGMLLEVYGDEWLVMPAMHYRWGYKRYNLRFILGQFGDALKPHWPRYVGRHEFSLGDAVGKRCVIPFQQWMFQRPLRYYQSLSAQDKRRIDPLLRELGGFHIFEVEHVFLDVVKIIKARKEPGH